MTEENKFRLQQLGWGGKVQKRRLDDVAIRTKAEIHAEKMKRELAYVKAWLERLANRYREKGYSAEKIDRIVQRIEKAMQ